MVSRDGLGAFAAVGRVVVLIEDPHAALAFYRDVLGFRLLDDEEGGGPGFLHIGLPGQPGFGIWLMTVVTAGERALVGRQSGHQPLFVMYTEDLSTVRTHLLAHGVSVWGERWYPERPSLRFSDLYGNVIVAAQLTPRSRVSLSMRGPFHWPTTELN